MPSSDLFLQAAVALPAIALLVVWLVGTRYPAATLLGVRLAWTFAGACAAAMLLSLQNNPADGLATAHRCSANWGTWLVVPNALGPLAFSVDWTLQADAFTGLLLTALLLISAAVFAPPDSGDSDVAQQTRFCRSGTLMVFAAVMVLVTSNLLAALLCWQLLTWAAAWLNGDAEPAVGRSWQIQSLGDLALGLAVLMLWCMFRTLNFDTGDATSVLSPQFVTDGYPQPQAYLLGVGLLMVLAVAGKCSQLPLWNWPKLAADNPRSLALQVGCLGTAGVYWLIRFAPLWKAAGEVHVILAWLGIGSACFAALAALAQTNIRPLLVYLAMAQLGLALFGISTGSDAGLVAGMWYWITQFAAITLLLCLVNPRNASGRGISVAASIGMASLAAVPPIGGFWSLANMFTASQQTSASPWLLGLMLSVTCVMAIAAGRGLHELQTPQPEETRADIASSPNSTVVNMLAAVVLLLGVVGPFAGQWLTKTLAAGAASDVSGIAWPSLTSVALVTSASAAGLLMAAMLFRRPSRWGSGKLQFAQQ